MQDPNKEYAFSWHFCKKSHLAADAFVFTVQTIADNTDQGLLSKTTFAGDCLGAPEIDKFALAC